MKISCCCLPLLACFFLNSCAPDLGIFMSPSEVRASPYVTLPMAADSQKTVTLVSAAFQGGGSNDGLGDNLLGGTASLMQSHQFGHFQAYYGAAFGAGSYDHAGQYFSPRYFTGFDTGSYKIPGGAHFFGYYGFNGGMNLVIPFANGKAEWRALGIDAAYRKEFGNYLAFRRKLDPAFVDLITTYDHIFTLGGSTEIVVRRARDGVQFGYKVAVGGIFYPQRQFIGYTEGNKPFYYTQTVALTKQRVTGYIQLSAGANAFAVQAGANFNLRPRTRGFPPNREPAEGRHRRVHHPRSPPNPFRRRKQVSGG